MPPFLDPPEFDIENWNPNAEARNRPDEVERGPDLSNCSIEVLQCILLRVPTENLVPMCSTVNLSWYKLLKSKSFWLAKGVYDGTNYLLKFLTENPDIDRTYINYGVLCLKQPFDRNLLAPHNPKGNSVTRHCDPRWDFGDANNMANIRYVLFDECYELSSSGFNRVFECSFASLGISSDILNLYHPTITFTEYVSNRADCASGYYIKTELYDKNYVPLEIRVDEIHFAQWQRQKWHRRSIVFDSYPSGVQGIRIETGGKDTMNWQGFYGPKFAGSSLEITLKPMTKLLEV